MWVVASSVGSLTVPPRLEGRHHAPRRLVGCGDDFEQEQHVTLPEAIPTLETRGRGGEGEGGTRAKADGVNWIRQQAQAQAQAAGAPR